MQYSQLMLTNCSRRVQWTVMMKYRTKKVFTSVTPSLFSK